MFYKDPCQSSPCQNYGTCFYHFSKNDPSFFYCKCKDDFEGDYCQNEIEGWVGFFFKNFSVLKCFNLIYSNKDPCKSNPCFNNAECVSNRPFKYYDYDCNCKENTHGSKCEITGE